MRRLVFCVAVFAACAQTSQAPLVPAGPAQLQQREPGAEPPRRDAELDDERVLEWPDGPAPAEVVDWLARNLIPIATAHVRPELDDLLPLERLVGAARVVSLGEATHGTREFFQLKHRIFAFLVEKKGFSIFAIEASMPEGFDVNDHVLTGRGDPEKALAGLYFWTWNTEEVLELIRWMRAWNADPTHPQKVKFYGFDMQDPTRAAKTALAFVHRVDPELEKEFAAALADALDPLVSQRLSNAPEGQKQALVRASQRLVGRFDAERATWSAQTSPADFDLARQHARILQQYANMRVAHQPAAQFAERDQSMAENIRWILEREPGARMVVWAHNGHVSTGKGLMGAYLREALGRAMVIFGFAFGHGGFQAIAGNLGGLADFTVEGAPPGSLDETLAAAKVPIAALDLTAIPKQGIVSRWFGARHRTRSIGALFDTAVPQSYFTAEITERMYDALLFVDRTTPARALPRGRPPRVVPLAAPTNLGFEEQADGQPTGWLANANADAFGYEVISTTKQPKHGRRSVVLARVAGLAYGEGSGGLSQRLDATAWRGKTLELGVFVRFARGGSSDGLRIWIASEGGRAKPVYAARVARPMSATWREETLVAVIPEDAVAIRYGFDFAGTGEVTLDDVRVVARQ